jgi:hypothetical protein
VVESVFGRVQFVESEGEIALVTGDMCEAEMNDRLEIIKSHGGVVNSRIRLL